MALTTEQKMQVMNWAVEMAKLEYQVQKGIRGSDTARSISKLDALKKSDKETTESPKKDLQTIVSTYYQFLLKQIDG